MKGFLEAPKAREAKIGETLAYADGEEGSTREALNRQTPDKSAFQLLPHIKISYSLCCEEPELDFPYLNL